MARPSKLNRTLLAQERNAERLTGLPNVVGVATGPRMRGGEMTDEVCVQVFVTRKLPTERLAGWEQVPQAVAGLENESVRTDVVEITPPVAHQDTGRYRPVPGGCSIGPESRTSAGTLGGWACDEADDTIVLLTNNHVISDLDTMPAARRVVQAGRLDGGTLPADVIGSLKRHIAVTTVANPPGTPPPAVSAVDAAIGTITADRTDQVLQIGPGIYEAQAPTVGMNVQKRGRTTQLTNNGQVFSINGTFNLRYRNGTRLGRIANTFVIRSTDGNIFSDRGDSGSLIFNQQRGRLNGTLPTVGLLYGGGTFNDGTPMTLACDINAVFGALNLTTLCTCAARAIIRAVFDQSERGEDLAGGEERTDRLVRRKERQLRQLRARVLPRTGFGKAFDHFVSTEAAELARVLLEDEEVFGLAVRTLEPWLRKRTNFDLLESTVDPETVSNVARLTKAMGRQSRNLRPALEALQTAVSRAEGAQVRDLLQTGEM